ncbi:hypothetical protein [Flavobacterium capsici]|uniref:Uncharacterized protein n=1 Tax=Flavobacterium capsici TaxID=3075618 RepID=A0AA96J364_9FLAO|nr:MULTISPECIES: hypothetical protein [unclassified Flavobacterium]WNM18943.1 hypothetical protein RN608_13130 [Flavobacterium sp. PMR2A8]WNM22993.1 hypothetical protein RN605_06430 [Flavobacterium sp. PMTSA4]
MRVDVINERCSLMYVNEVIFEITPKIRKTIIQVISEECPEIPRIRIASILDREIKRTTTPVVRRNFLATINYSLR